MNTYDDYPFKFEIIDCLVTLNEIQGAIRASHYFFSSVLLATQLLVNVNIDRDHLNIYFPKYQNTQLYVERYEGWYDYIYSLPDKTGYDSANLWSKEELQYYEEMNFSKLSFRNLRNFYRELISALKVSKHEDEAAYMLKHVFISEEQYIWAYNMVNTRSFAIEFNWYK